MIQVGANGIDYAVGGYFAADSAAPNLRSKCWEAGFGQHANQLEWSRDCITFRFSFVCLNVGSLIFISKLTAAI